MIKTLGDHFAIPKDNGVFVDSKGNFYLAYLQRGDSGVRLIPLSNQGTYHPQAIGIFEKDLDKYIETCIDDAEKKIKNLQTNVYSWKTEIDDTRNTKTNPDLSENKPYTLAVEWLHEQLLNN